MCSTCFFSTNQTPLPYLYHQIRQNFRISFFFVVVYAMGDQLPSSNRMWIFCLLETRVCKARRPATFISTQFGWVFLSWVHISSVQVAWSIAFRPDFEASVVNSYYVQRELTTVGSTPEKICFCLFVCKLCNCNPLKKSAELLSAFLHHLTSGR